MHVYYKEPVTGLYGWSSSVPVTMDYQSYDSFSVVSSLGRLGITGMATMAI